MSRPSFQKRSRVALLDSSIIRVELGGHDALLVNGRSDTAERRWTEKHGEPALLLPVCTVCGVCASDPIGVDLTKQAMVAEAAAIARALAYYHPCENAEVVLVQGETGRDELFSVSDTVTWLAERHPLTDGEVLPWLQDWLTSIRDDIAEEYGVAAELNPRLMATRRLPEARTLPARNGHDPAGTGHDGT